MEPRETDSERPPHVDSGDEFLVVSGLQAGYGSKQVVYDVDISFGRGRITTVIGHNGAGKTTILKTLFGLLPVMGGQIILAGENITGSSSRRNARRGMSYIPAEHFVFGELTVQDNLRLGALLEKSASDRKKRNEEVVSMFPILGERGKQRAGTLSGGQQRMLSLGVALMSNPSVLLLDEPSLGLAPALVTEIFDRLRALVDERGMTIILLEQNVGQAVRIADRVVVIRSGRVLVEESAEQMRQRADYWDLF